MSFPYIFPFLFHVLPLRYTIEIRDSGGTVIGIPKDIFVATLEEAVNVANVLSFSIPATDDWMDDITRPNEFWVRDMKSDVVIAKTRLLRREDSQYG